MDKHEELMHRGYVADACNAMKIIFVYKSEDLTQIITSANCYKPLMAHQIFAEEAIYGYLGLSICIFYLAYSGHCYFKIQYEKCYVEDGKPSLENDDIIELLSPWFPSFTLDLAEIHELLARERKTHMFGIVVGSFTHHNPLVQSSTYKVTQCSIKEQGFVQFHLRFQSLIIMYIDAANFIELTDEKWMIFYLYNQRSLGKDVSGNYPIGFCTVYKFFKYPDKVRARISQFFIIPPYQRMGLGYKFLDAVYDALKSMDDVAEITVESPNEIFTRLRDNLDLNHVINLPEFNATNIVNGYSTAMRNATLTKFKLSRRQSIRLYHIIRYYTLHVKRSDNFKAYKADVIAHLDFALKKRCYRNYYNEPAEKFLSVENESEKRKFLEHQFYVFLKEIQASVQHLRQRLRA